MPLDHSHRDTRDTRNLGYWLSLALRRYAAAVFEVSRTHCVARGKTYVITPPQWGILSRLAHGHAETISALAHQVGVDSPAVTNLVKRLEQNDLVERVRDREDQRVVKVSLTAEGQDIAHSLGPVLAAFHERLLSSPQRQVLVEQLQHFIAQISAAVPQTADRLYSSGDHLLWHQDRTPDNTPDNTQEHSQDEHTESGRE
jgi:DNA-binding MarR family transcriptional regulator